MFAIDRDHLVGWATHPPATLPRGDIGELWGVEQFDPSGGSAIDEQPRLRHGPAGSGETAGERNASGSVDSTCWRWTAHSRAQPDARCIAPCRFHASAIRAPPSRPAQPVHSESHLEHRSWDTQQERRLQQSVQGETVIRPAIAQRLRTHHGETCEVD
jgi:hypothetical protein